MEKVTVTSKGQITIPSKMRRTLNIVKGTNLIVVQEGNTLRIIPVTKLSELACIDKKIFEKEKPSEEIEESRKEWDEDFERRFK
ncbi:MAG: AbrB/MazE/SpoVT family DNA-binding domain-containing protein [Nitrososphaeria archaeon]|nr:AbrB/MazE/SpoVT family DNA-binding domain-containing protein [Nitrososphaeria archaeon]